MNFDQLWLASASPRRRQILGWTGIQFHFLSTDIDESINTGEKAEDYVSRLAVEKANAAIEKIPSDGLVIAADTTVVLNGEVLGKPVDRADASQMLTSLRNRQHEVITALVLLKLNDRSFVKENVYFNHSDA